MRKIAILAMTLFSLTALGCSQKTEALANKSLMARPLEHQQATPPSQNGNSATKPAQTATTH
jgi:hypothetical protein